MTAERDSAAEPDPSGQGDPPGQPARPLSVLIAGGGTAGHIEPAMNTADALRVLRPDVRIVALGTPKGLENTLVPQRGYELALVPPVPLPRKPSLDLVKLPGRLRTAVRQTRAIIAEHDVQVVIGFGGYVCLPAYLAARGRVPIVVHEANARAGLANKVGARFAARVLAAVDGSGLPRAEVVGIPVRSTIAGLDRATLRSEAREFFGLDPHAPTLLAFGGSQGAVRINEAVSGAAARFAAAGVGVLHAYGRKNAVSVAQVPGAPPYVAVPYVDRMDLAYAAADLALGRSGAMTVAELGAVGLPAVYVPLPHGNGEQRLNAAEQLAAGSAIAIDDADLTAAVVASTVIPLLADPELRTGMAAAAARTARPDVAAEVARIVLETGAGGPS